MKKITVLVLSIFLTMQILFSGGVNEKIVNNTISTPMEEMGGERSISEILYSLSNVYALLDRYYLYEIDNEAMAENLLSAMIASLGDRYSYYVKAEDMSEYEEQYTGEYVGIGTYVSKMNPIYADYDDPLTWMLQIVSPFPGGPADRAGLRANDLISAINGESVYSLNATEASRLLRGKEGESLTLSVYRDGNEFEITLMPEHVITPNLAYDVIYDDVGYLHLYTFNESSTESVKEALDDMKARGIKSLVIDLRNNGGGTVDTSEEITDMFLSEGAIVNVRFKEGSGVEDTTYYADRNTQLDADIPIVILVNGGTASASEIMTAALKENGRATVIGGQTFGKGIIQSVIPYNGGFICFTDANYYTPSGNSIHEVGIKPDIIIEDREYTEEELKSYEEFLSTDKIEKYMEAHPEYSIENIETFADENSDSGVPRDMLILLIRNEYYYQMDYENRPVVLVDYDEALQEALTFLGKEI